MARANLDDMKAPSINMKPPANAYVQDGEKIIEFSSGSYGGLISLWTTEDGITVTVYRTDPGVRVITGPETQTFTDAIDATSLVAWFRGLPAKEREQLGLNELGQPKAATT